jgi:uncharacterized protein
LLLLEEEERFCGDRGVIFRRGGVSLEIKVADIPEEGLFFEIEEEREFLEWRGDRFPFKSPVLGWLRIEFMGDRLCMVGEIHAVLELFCARCLSPYPFNVDVEFMDENLPLRLLEKSEEELCCEKLDVAFVGDVIDVWDVCLEKIYLSLPMKPLCSDECMGLCPHCGIDLNHDRCDCAEERHDSPLEMLRDFKEMLTND